MKQIFYEADGRFESRIYQDGEKYLGKVADSEITVRKICNSFDEAYDFIQNKKNELKPLYW